MASRSSSKVIISEDKILEWGVAIERAVEVVLPTTVSEMTLKAKALEVPRDDGGLNAGIHPMPIVKTAGGYETGVGSSDFKALWYEKGTKAHSNQKKSSVRLVSDKGRGVRSAAGTAGFVSGVRGYHYLASSLYSTFPRFLARLKAVLE